MKAQALISGWGPDPSAALESLSPWSTGLAQSFLQLKTLESSKENTLSCTKCRILVGQSQQAELTRAGIYSYQGLGG